MSTASVGSSATGASQTTSGARRFSIKNESFDVWPALSVPDFDFPGGREDAHDVDLSGVMQTARNNQLLSQVAYQERLEDSFSGSSLDLLPFAFGAVGQECGLTASLSASELDDLSLSNPNHSSHLDDIGLLEHLMLRDSYDNLSASDSVVSLSSSTSNSLASTPVYTTFFAPPNSMMKDQLDSAAVTMALSKTPFFGSDVPAITKTHAEQTQPAQMGMLQHLPQMTMPMNAAATPIHAPMSMYLPQVIPCAPPSTPTEHGVVPNQVSSGVSIIPDFGAAAATSKPKRGRPRTRHLVPLGAAGAGANGLIPATPPVCRGGTTKRSCPSKRRDVIQTCLESDSSLDLRELFLVETEIQSRSATNSASLFFGNEGLVPHQQHGSIDLQRHADPTNKSDQSNGNSREQLDNEDIEEDAGVVSLRPTTKPSQPRTAIRQHVRSSSLTNLPLSTPSCEELTPVASDTDLTGRKRRAIWRPGQYRHGESSDDEEEEDDDDDDEDDDTDEGGENDASKGDDGDESDNEDDDGDNDDEHSNAKPRRRKRKMTGARKVSHNEMERRRRKELRVEFHRLRLQLPALEHEKAAKIVILEETNNYIDSLMAKIAAGKAEIAKLVKEREYTKRQLDEARCLAGSLGKRK